MNFTQTYWFEDSIRLNGLLFFEYHTQNFITGRVGNGKCQIIN